VKMDKTRGKNSKRVHQDTNNNYRKTPLMSLYSQTRKSTDPIIHVKLASGSKGSREEYGAQTHTWMRTMFAPLECASRTILRNEEDMFKVWGQVWCWSNLSFRFICSLLAFILSSTLQRKIPELKIEERVAMATTITTTTLFHRLPSTIPNLSLTRSQWERFSPPKKQKALQRYCLLGGHQIQDKWRQSSFCQSGHKNNWGRGNTTHFSAFATFVSTSSVQANCRAATATIRSSLFAISLCIRVSLCFRLSRALLVCRFRGLPCFCAHRARQWWKLKSTFS
jgi:hypothetical protein